MPVQSPPITPPTQAPSFAGRFGALGRDIKLSHSVFALPFALLATSLAAAGTGAAPHRLPSALALGLIVVCMVAARTMAMSFNRLADARLDALNPRTAARALPSGRLGRAFVLGVAIGCAMVFVAATAVFWLVLHNPWPLLLAPAVLAWLCFYSYTKRFTWLCHIVLGSSLALSPVGACVAIDPHFLVRPEPYLLFVLVLCWVAGFDVIYSLQDVAIDRAQGLYSMPAHLGIEPALWISRALHLVALGALVALARLSPVLGPGFAIGVAIVGALLALEHALVWGSRTHHIDTAFFTVNGAISLLLGRWGF